MKHMEKIDQFMNERKFEAMIEYVKSLHEDELDFDILHTLSFAYLNTYQYEECINTLVLMKDEGKDIFTWWHKYAYCLLHLGQYEEAMRCINIALEIFSDIENDIDQDPDYVRNVLNYLKKCIQERLDNPDVNFLTLDEEETLKEFIGTKFGAFEDILYETISDAVHINIIVIKPTKERNYYTIATVGASARKMNVPDDIQVPKRFELFMRVSPDWEFDKIINDEQRINLNDEEFENIQWPIRAMKILSHVPFDNNNFYNWFHTVSMDMQETKIGDTNYTTFMLHGDFDYKNPDDPNYNDILCNLPNGDAVEFFQVTPLFEEEYSLLSNLGTYALLAKFADANMDYIVRRDRKNSALGYTPDPEDVFDSVWWHEDNITTFNLPLDSIVALNHMAIFVRFCYENNMTSDGFNHKFAGLILNGTDYRDIIKNYLNSRLSFEDFNETGQEFVGFCYDTYRGDIDSTAKKYFKHHDKPIGFRDTEGYLFMPYGDEYYELMKAVLNKYYKRCFRRSVQS